jgi:diacylglycerol kinase (ATP)
MLVSQQNARIHAVATLFVCLLGVFLRLDRMEWCGIALAIAGVWMAEALNTALEFLADAAVPQFHPRVGKAKDVAAGAVLLAAGCSVVIGILVLGPHLSHALGSG